MPLKFSPIVADATGKVGSTVYTHGRAGRALRPRAAGPVKLSDTQGRFRSLLAQAHAEWRALAPASRQLWSERAASITAKNRLGDPYKPTGLQMFLAAFLRQGGSPSPITPGVPTRGGRAPSLKSLLIHDLGNVKLAGFDRNLEGSEKALIRTLTPAPASWSRPPHKILSYTTLTPSSGLGAGAQTNLAFNGTTSGARATLAGAAHAASTIEFWFLLTNPQVNPDPVILELQTPLMRVRPFRPDRFSIYIGGTEMFYDVSPTLDTWHYFALTESVGPTLWTPYLDGQPLGPPFAAPSLSLIGNMAVFSSYLFGARATGRAGQLRIRDGVLPAGTIAANWSEGYGFPLGASPPTRHLWRFETQAAGLTPDDGPDNEPLTVTNLTDAPGEFNRILLNPDQRWPAADGQLQVITQALDTQFLTALSTRTKLTW